MFIDKFLPKYNNSVEPAYQLNTRQKENRLDFYTANICYTPKTKFTKFGRFTHEKSHLSNEAQSVVQYVHS